MWESGCARSSDISTPTDVARACRAAAAVVLVLMFSLAPMVDAAVWGYIDEQGKPHLATEQLDERYRLFFKGKTEAQLAADAAAKAAPQPDEAFVRSPLVRRVEAHPNVKKYEPLLALHAREYGVDLALVKAVVAVESAYEPGVVSPKGAVGLMQVVPDTAVRYGVSDDAKRTVEQKLRDPAINIRVGTRYLAELLARFGGDIALAVAAYNAGEGAVERYGSKVPPFPETQEFVKLVLQFHDLYKPPPPPPPSRITIPRRAEVPTSAIPSAE